MPGAHHVAVMVLITLEKWIPTIHRMVILGEPETRSGGQRPQTLAGAEPRADANTLYGEKYSFSKNTIYRQWHRCLLAQPRV